MTEGSDSEDDDDEDGVDPEAYVRQLHAFLEPRMLRRLKHNVSKELPPKITRKVCLSSPTSQGFAAKGG